VKIHVGRILATLGLRRPGPGGRPRVRDGAGQAGWPGSGRAV